MSISVYVVTHKKIDAVLPDYCKRTQINVANTEAWSGYIHDNDGENISLKNPFYCELTALYHLWKNSDADYKGLYHYRRFFTNTDSRDCTLYYPRMCSYQDLKKEIITEDKIREILRENDIILSVPHNPFPATVIEALSKFISLENIRLMIDIIEELYPEYSEPLWTILKSYQISYCNMFVSTQEFTKEYCEWLFDILGEVENRVGKDSKGNPPKRMFGYLSEVLLNVYVQKKHLKVKYLDMLMVNELTAKQRLINQVKKRFNQSFINIGIMPGWKKKAWRKLYLYRTRLLQGEKPQLEVNGDFWNAVENYYESVGARTVAVKTIDNDTKYLRAVMNYPVANECFIVFVSESEKITERIKYKKDKIINIEKGDYHCFVRVYARYTFDEENRELFFLNNGILLMKE